MGVNAMKMTMRPLILVYLFTICLSIKSEAQSNLVRAFDASCTEVCDGSAEFLTFRYLPERYFYWMSEKEGRYHTMNSAILDSLCPGQYRIRQVDVAILDLNISQLNDTSLAGFEGISSFEFSSIGKREISLFLKLDKELNHLNYYLKSEYSTDKGRTWHSSQQFHQKVIEDAGGNKHVHYLVNFPRSAQEKQSVQVKIYQRRTESLSGQPDFVIEKAFLESKEFEEYAFEIKVKEHLSIRSTISNELEGVDGYISLELSGGSPPYSVSWNDGHVGTERKGLISGSYQADVMDHKGCKESARFVVLPKEGTATGEQFTLLPTNELSLYELVVKNIYRQPIDLVFSAQDSTEVKRFQINPLYEDLRMDLDLSFLQSGEYTATLSTASYSKKVAFQID
jgi:hypothetical protein